MSHTSKSKWPKVLPELTADQQRINDAFVKMWHEELPKKYGIVERFNHNFPTKTSDPSFVTTLEVGAGLGEHLAYESLSDEQEAGYYCNEVRPSMAQEIVKRFPSVHTVIGDCQQRMDFPDEYFDRALAIHVLEHLPNLPAAIAEIHRLLNKRSGQFLVVIPTEGGMAYWLGRKISAERIYKKRFGGDYSWFYRREHINRPAEIIRELSQYFTIEKKSFFPLLVPSINLNICIGLSLRPRAISAH